MRILIQHIKHLIILLFMTWLLNQNCFNKFFFRGYELENQ